MTITYFAYGSCMDYDDFKRTVEDFHVLGRAVLRGYRLGFTLYGEGRYGGVADIVPDPESAVEGVLYQFDDSLLPHLDQREGVHVGMYERITVTVEHDGQEYKAYTYQVLEKAEQEIAPSYHYSRLILNGLEQYATEGYLQGFRQHLKDTFGIEMVNFVPDEGPQDKRLYQRVHLNVPLQLDIHQWKEEGSFQGQSYEGVLEDLSEGGLRLRTGVPLALDMFIRIHFPQESGLIPLIGRIIRCEVLDEGIYSYGCMVTGLTLYERKKLEAYIELRKGS